MSKMIDLIRQSAVPANVMRSASKGALAVPADEMVEILVHLTTTPLFAEAARESARCSQCQNNFKQLGIGLNSFESTHKKYPAGQRWETSASVS